MAGSQDSNVNISETSVDVDSDAIVLCCGKNESGELALPRRKGFLKPRSIGYATSETISFLSTGYSHSGFITNKGELFMFGNGLHRKLGVKSGTIGTETPTLFKTSAFKRVRQVACGESHTLCLFEDGDLFGWGGTLHNKLGQKSMLPSRLPGFDRIKLIEIGCGEFYSAALSNRGALFTWGGGGVHANFGQCGHGTTETIGTPTRVEFFRRINISAFACGRYHMLAIGKTEQGPRVFSWGSGVHGQLGSGSVS